jgi:hypothetical protein
VGPVPVVKTVVTAAPAARRNRLGQVRRGGVNNKAEANSQTKIAMLTARKNVLKAKRLLAAKKRQLGQIKSRLVGGGGVARVGQLQGGARRSNKFK